MPKTKSNAKQKPKAAKRAVKQPATPAKRARGPAERTRTAAPKGKQAAGPGIDPRVVAAIGFALEDEAAAEHRAGQLQQELSPWTALGRVRVSRGR